MALALGVLLSGKGHVLEALLNNDTGAEVAAVVSNREASGLAPAKLRGIPTYVIDERGFASRIDHEKEILQSFDQHGVKAVLMTGYARVLSPSFLTHYYDEALSVPRVLNIHPSLLPAFSGREVYKRVFESGVKYTGATVHFAYPEADTGPVILQKPLEIAQDDTYESFREKMSRLEAGLACEALKLYTEGRISIKGKKTVIR